VNVRYDLIIIGGGHNGLTTAALAAGRGRKVLVLEARDVPGGLAAGEEFHPGYRATGILHDTSGVRQSVIDALELETHGLRRNTTATDIFAPETEGSGLLLAGDPSRATEEIRRLSASDAERYPAFLEFRDRVGGYVRGLLAEPPPDISPRRLGQYFELFRKGWGLRRLGRETMYECLRIGPTCVEDWLDEWFEGDLLKATLAAPALLGTWTGPRSAGTTALLLMHQSVAYGEIHGGPAALVKALVAACADKGVAIRTGSRVRAIRVESGRAVGVELEGGESCEATHIASSLDPKRTFLELLRPLDLPVGMETPILNWRSRGTTAKVHLALDGPLEFASRPDESFENIRIASSLTEIERAFDGVKYRELPTAPHLDVRVPSLLDPTLAPDGHHVVSILLHFVPYELEGGWTDARREELLRTTLARLGAVSPTCADRIVGHQVLTPVDLENEFGITGGHVHHGEHGLDQMFALRPHARCARYATPMPGLFLCGSGSHPGGGITCAPGELAAAAIQ
jgi:phytoene dehydrogenase-like protein